MHEQNNLSKRKLFIYSAFLEELILFLFHRTHFLYFLFDEISRICWVWSICGSSSFGTITKMAPQCIGNFSIDKTQVFVIDRFFFFRFERAIYFSTFHWTAVVTYARLSCIPVPNPKSENLIRWLGRKTRETSISWVVFHREGEKIYLCDIINSFETDKSIEIWKFFPI